MPRRLRKEKMAAMFAYNPGSTAAVAGELRITERSAELLLQDLHLRGLSSLGSAVREYAYAPTSSELKVLVDALAECDGTKQYTVIASTAQSQ
jgi:hypothetical protein